MVALLNARFGGKLSMKLIEGDGEPMPLPIIKRVAQATNDDPVFERRQHLTCSDDGKSIAWTEEGSFAWLPCPTKSLFDRDFRIEFDIVSQPAEQVGVGFALAPLDLGFYGYLGASDTSFAYDPSSGDIVSATAELRSGLAKLPTGCGTIGLHCKLTDRKKCSAQFLVNGVPASGPIELPPESIVQPAVCLLRRGQRVNLKNFSLL